MEGFRAFLDDFEVAKPWLARVGFRDEAAAHRNFVHIAERNLPLDLLEYLRDELARYLPTSADPDMAFNNFERMLTTARSPLSIATFLERKPLSLAILLQIFASSQYFSDLIVASPDYFDFLWEEGHKPIDGKQLAEEILAEIRPVGDDDERILTLIRRHRHRELLRIGFRDIVLGEPIDRITESISDLADCLVEVALAVAYRRQAAKYGEPRAPEGQLSRLVVLGMGKLGGRELNYSSDIDLVLIYDRDGATDGSRKLANNEFFARVISDMVRLLASNALGGQAYRVDLRLRPHGDVAPLCLSLRNTLAYYDTTGRTWERQALIKARPIAGWLKLGEDFLKAIEPFVYRRYLSHVEINEIKAIKRRIEGATRSSGGDATDLKTGHGGIRDIEFVTQFLQLLNGRRLKDLRERNTLRALKKLADFGCVNRDEHAALDFAYRFLRKAEHRLQFMFDLQTHRIPESPSELDKLAIRLGYSQTGAHGAGEDFLADLRAITERNRAILNHLMHDLFREEGGGRRGVGEPESDLLLDPEPDPKRVADVMGRYRFQDLQGAYRNLTQLAREDVPFLSSVRCRHFLASVAPLLLRLVAEAPDPDMALINLEKVTASLGAKGALWESCSQNPQLLRLYVNLCSWSQYLSEILIKNPGMIDELLDTLVLNRSPDLDELRVELERLLKGANDVDPILHSFRDTRLLEIGVQDIMGKQRLQQTLQYLSELAEVVIGAVTDRHFQALVAEHGAPMHESDEGGQRNCRYVLLALGKFGGAELNYQSDLDMVLVYERDGHTEAKTSAPKGTTINHHFFSELAQRIVRTAGRLGPLGRLYAIDLRLRPTGASGSLVAPLDKFEKYYQPGGGADLWERQALTRSRVVFGNRTFGRSVMSAVRRAICRPPWSADMASQIHMMRERLEASRSPTDIKRGKGGVVDVEFAVQLMQIRHGAKHKDIVRPNLWESLIKIAETGLWSPETIRVFDEGYTFLRRIESRLRIVYNTSHSELPERPADLEKLAYRLGYEGADAGPSLRQDLERHTHDIRREYLAALERERARR